MRLIVYTKPTSQLICEHPRAISLYTFTAVDEDGNKLGLVTGDKISEILEKVGFEIIEKNKQ